jgi:hypothetical protein
MCGGLSGARPMHSALVHAQTRVTALDHSARSFGVSLFLQAPNESASTASVINKRPVLPITQTSRDEK